MDEARREAGLAVENIVVRAFGQADAETGASQVLRVLEELLLAGYGHLSNQTKRIAAHDDVANLPVTGQVSWLYPRGNEAR